MELKTAEDVISKVEELNLDEIILRELVLILANEIKNTKTLLASYGQELEGLRKQLFEQKLLIEHEEKVRTSKAKTSTGGKNVSTKFKANDIVDYNPIGTAMWVKSKVHRLHNGRVKIELLETVRMVGRAGVTRWVGPRQLRYHTTDRS